MVQLRQIPTPQQAIEALRRMGLSDEELLSVVTAVEERERKRTLVTIAEAAKLRGIARARIRAWVDRGQIEVVGWRPKGSPGRPGRLISLEAVDALLRNPPPKGRPPVN